ncbi:hypothetical protein [Streptomyces sp. NPDC046862]|uniref:hypothetical protein n=1 Tax=Streptomyces sp. NPDC046862 TaxID=3154603 RepID=UPI003453F1E6
MGEDPSIGMALFNMLLVGAEGTVRGAAVLLPVIGLVACLTTWWRRRKTAAARSTADVRTSARPERQR